MGVDAEEKIWLVMGWVITMFRDSPKAVSLYSLELSVSCNNAYNFDLVCL